MLVRLGHSLARVKIWGHSTPQGPKYGLPKNATWGRSTLALITWFVVDGISQIFLFNAGLTVFDNAIYRLSISLSSLEIFVVKLKSCRKTY